MTRTLYEEDNEQRYRTTLHEDFYMWAFAIHTDNERVHLSKFTFASKEEAARAANRWEQRAGMRDAT